MADYTANMQKALGIPGFQFLKLLVYLLHRLPMLWNGFTIIPGLKNLHVDTGELNKKVGIFGDPIVLGFILGTLLGLVVGYDLAAAGTLGIKLGAVMLILPRMVKIIMEGLMPVSEAAKKFMQSSSLDKSIILD